MTEPNTDALTALYAEHHDPPEAIVSKLPKGKEDKSKRAGCRICGGYHDPSMFHLDYVGHADVTRVLIEADPLWSWEPMALTPDGLPAFDRDNQGQPVGLWIRLTVHGKTMLGYGSCEASKADGEKELIGDAIRNAAMRFGIALDLWSKADQTGEGGNRTAPPARSERPAPVDLTAVTAAIADAKAAGLEVDVDAVRAHAQQGNAQAAQAERVLRQRIEEHQQRSSDVCDICGQSEDGHTHETSGEGGSPVPPSPDPTDEGQPSADNDGPDDQEDDDAAGEGKPPTGDDGQASPSSPATHCHKCGQKLELGSNRCPDCSGDELPHERADRLGISAADQMLKLRELAPELQATVPARRQYVGTGKCHPGLTDAFLAWLDEVEAELNRPVGADRG